MNNDRKIFVQLGRYGDILNILPLALQEYQRTGVVPMIQVAKEFAGLLDGVSYALPLVFDGDFRDAQRAIFQARLKSRNVVISQIYGSGIRQPEDCWSFVRQSWVQCGADVPWGTLPLVFDRRSEERESVLRENVLGRLIRSGTKIVLLFTGGISSPFPHGKWLAKNLCGVLGPDYTVVDITRVPVERLYDLLALYDAAHCLISTDTGTLHLAPASPVPVIALTNPQPKEWHGTCWRSNQVANFTYDDFPGCLPDVAQAVAAARAATELPGIVHAYADFRDGAGADQETARRQDIAQQSWAMEYKTWDWRPFPLRQGDAPRTGALIGDSPLPFVRDVVSRALTRIGKGNDIIALTNADVCFTPGLTGRVLDACRRRGAAFTHRWDFYKLQAPLVSESQVSYGKWYPGSDAFFFTCNWWLDHGHELGDFLMGREHWDQALRFLMKFHGAQGIEKGIYHEKHASAWEQPELRDVLPGNLHNRKLFDDYADQLGVRGSDWIWWKACDVNAVYRHG